MQSAGFTFGCLAGEAVVPKHLRTFDRFGRGGSLSRRHRFGKGQRREHGQSEHQSGACGDPRVQDEVVPTNEQPVLANPAANLTSSLDSTTKQAPRGRLGRNDVTELRRTVGSRSEWSRRSLRGARSRRARCSYRSTLRSAFHCPRSSISFCVLVPRAASMEGPLWRAMYGTRG